MTKRKKPKGMTHEELFFYTLDCAKEYFEYGRDENAKLDLRTMRGKMIIFYAHYIEQLHRVSAEEGVEI